VVDADYRKETAVIRRNGVDISLSLSQPAASTATGGGAAAAGAAAGFPAAVPAPVARRYAAPPFRGMTKEQYEKVKSTLPPPVSRAPCSRRRPSPPTRPAE